MKGFLQNDEQQFKLGRKKHSPGAKGSALLRILHFLDDLVILIVLAVAVLVHNNNCETYLPGLVWDNTFRAWIVTFE